MKIRDWPPHERPREKLLQHGAASLTDAELLAIFLQTGTAGVSALDIARDVLTHYGGLSGLLAADRKGFCAQRGLGEARYTLLRAALEISRRQVYAQVRESDVLTSPDEVRHYLSLQLAALEHEVFALLLLDSRHRVIAYRELFRGTLDSAAVYPREVVKCCLACNAAAVILTHNHPSGVAEPSDTDLRLTRRLTDALALIDIQVLDHLVVGRGEQVSLAERGLL